MRKNPIQSLLSASVLLLHLLFLFLILKEPLPRAHKRNALVVKMHQTPKQLASFTSSPSSSPAPAPIKKKSSPPAKKSPPAQPTKRPTPAPKKSTSKAATPTAKKTNPPRQKQKKAAPPRATEPAKPLIPQELLDQLEESIAKIDTKRDKGSSSNTQPSSLPSRTALPQPFNLDAPLAASVGENALEEEKTGGYQEKLVGCLHNALHLPDHGEVTISLTLRGNGSVEKVVIIRAESKKNQQYIEKQLPFIRFPSFEGPLQGKQSEVFILTFCNEL